MQFTNWEKHELLKWANQHHMQIGQQQMALNTNELDFGIALSADLDDLHLGDPLFWQFVQAHPIMNVDGRITKTRYDLFDVDRHEAYNDLTEDELFEKLKKLHDTLA